MSLPHTLLTLASACGLWWGGHALSCSQENLFASANPPAFAVPESAYGSLVARLIRDSLYSYWHGGESASPAVAAQSSKDASPPPPPGRFARRGLPVPVPQNQVPADVSWLEASIGFLARLEKDRTKRSSTLPLSSAHQRFLNAAADVRLRFAYQLDPGDTALYEILHFHIASRTQSPDDARAALNDLAQSAMAYAVREGGSLSDALTGAGAAINLLNDQLQPGNPSRSDQAIASQWHALDQCMQRFRDLCRQAQSEGWWNEIPEVRRQEIEEHAKLLTRIGEMIRPLLPQTPALPSSVLRVSPSGSH